MCAAARPRQIWVPMFRVRRRQGAADLGADVQGAPDLERALAVDHVRQLDAFEELHDEVHRAVGGGARIGDVDDVGVPDLGRRARLPAKAGHQIGLS